jgi:hypothetical protein
MSVWMWPKKMASPGAYLRLWTCHVSGYGCNHGSVCLEKWNYPLAWSWLLAIDWWSFAECLVNITFYSNWMIFEKKKCNFVNCNCNSRSHYLKTFSLIIILPSNFWYLVRRIIILLSSKVLSNIRTYNDLIKYNTRRMPKAMNKTSRIYLSI